MLLARVAGHLYWSARYLERAASTARIVREHTNLLIDLPVGTPLTWEPLLAIPGTTASYLRSGKPRDEARIVHWVVVDEDNPSSISASVRQARENLRATREIIPTQFFTAVNELHLFVEAQLAAVSERASRSRVLDRVIEDVQFMWGVLEDSMRRDEANALLALGRYVERADMTTRVLDVRAVSLLTAPTADSYADLQWAGVLRSVSALQMYQRTVNGPVSGPAVVRFLLGDESFPRSVGHNLSQLERITATLPRCAVPLQACASARAELAARWDSLVSEDPEQLRDALDALQIAVAAVSDALTAAYVVVDG
jgi:uncharacterized alpha-E superfamily protein